MKAVRNTSEYESDGRLEREFAEKYRISLPLIRYIVSKGYDSEEKMSRFFSPSEKNLADPFLIGGMAQLVERLNLAVENGESVVIYGDYDADGVCASAILYDFLSHKGLEVNCFLPTREQGYGLSVKTIDIVMEEYMPDLIVTVDCGITAVSEVEYVLDLGGDIIITDHHTPGGEFPSCITVNPKLDEGGLFHELCGAGVALKIVQAMDSLRFRDYIDICAIATIADSVPLIMENRDIVSAGLAQMSGNPKPFVSAFLQVSGKSAPLSVDDIAYYLAPIINAAGRMDNPMYALMLIRSGDEETALEYAEHLSKLNAQRKLDCESHTKSIIERIKAEKGFKKPIISVAQKDIPTGIMGIVAAKLVETYLRPAMVFSFDGENYHGSLRGVDGLDLCEMLSYAKDYIVGFGGHKMAAGASVAPKNFEAFEEKVCEYLNGLGALALQPKARFDFELNMDELGENPAEQLSRLQPMGFGFEKPVVRIDTLSPNITSFGGNPKFLKIGGGDFPQVTTFNGDRYIDALRSGFKLSIFAELSSRLFNRKNYLSLDLKEVAPQIEVDRISCEVENSRILEMLYLSMRCKEGEVSSQSEFSQRLHDALKNPFGTIILCPTRKSYAYFKQKILAGTADNNNLECSTVRPSGSSGRNSLVLAASGNIDFSNFSDVFILGDGVISGFGEFVRKKYGVSVTVGGGYCLDLGNLQPLSADIPLLRTYYKLFTNNLNDIAPDLYSWFDIFKKFNYNITLTQFIFSALVFLELGLVRFDSKSGNFSVSTGISVNLTDSQLYRKVAQLTEKE